jgi:hypothetical protein
MVSTPTATVRVERRAHVRFAASQLNGLHAARVKYGDDITVIDLSSSGVLFETTAPLAQEATIVLEFSGPTRTDLIPSRIVRCQSLPAIDHQKRSKGACAFKRPLRLKDLVVGSAAAQDATWHAVVAKYRDGSLVSGYTRDFSPSKAHMHVSPTVSAKETRVIQMTELDALFFLRDARDTGERENTSKTDGPYGRKVALLLPNGEELTGSTLNYSRQTSGVFIYPFEGDFGVSRVFVTPHGIRHLRLL